MAVAQSNSRLRRHWALESVYSIPDRFTNPSQEALLVRLAPLRLPAGVAIGKGEAHGLIVQEGGP